MNRPVVVDRPSSSSNKDTQFGLVPEKKLSVSYYIQELSLISVYMLVFRVLLN